MHKAPDYSAAYVVLRTDAEDRLEGHGLTFTAGRGTEVCVAAIECPMRASLRFDGGAEGFRFEVKSITPQKIEDKDGKLFKPPEGYFEIQPLPF